MAAAHLLRDGAGPGVGEGMRDAGESNWRLYWPEASYWPDSMAAADALMTACPAQLGRWQASRWYADGTLPAATWLVGQAADRLRLARVERLLDDAWPEEEAMLALLGRVGFRELTRTARGWIRPAGPPAGL